MGLNIAVCVKPIPDPKYYNEITIDPVSKTVKRQGIPTIINPIDKHAIEQALSLKEQHGGKVILMSMAPPDVRETIQEGLAMGADEAYLLSDRKFAGSDTLATSYVLAQGIKKIGGIDLVLTGSESGDGATAQVSSQLGEWLGYSHLWGVIDCQVKSQDDVYLRTKIENGYMEWVGKLPLVLAVSREINTPRYTSIMGVIKAKKRPFTIWSFQDMELDETYVGLKGSPTQAGDIFSPDMSRKGELIKGSEEEVVKFITEILRANGISLEPFAGGNVRGQR
ncbi:MAG: electron transfer flavoprotein subunit beta/FixA family protein [Dehalobacterium sp.]